MFQFCRLKSALAIVLLFMGVAYATEIEWESEPGLSLPHDRMMRPSDAILELARDYNGDGVKDLLYLEKDPREMTVVSGADPNVTWSFPIVAQFPQQDLRFLGFYDLDGTDGKEALFARKIGRWFRYIVIVTQNRIIRGFSKDFVLISILDFDSDGDPELFIGDVANRRLQFFGKGNQ